MIQSLKVLFILVQYVDHELSSLNPINHVVIVTLSKDNIVSLHLDEHAEYCNYISRKQWYWFIDLKSWITYVISTNLLSFQFFWNIYHSLNDFSENNITSLWMCKSEKGIIKHHITLLHIFVINRSNELKLCSHKLAGICWN